MKNKDLGLLQPYCENGMERLKHLSRSTFRRFHVPLSESDYDDFYSVANMTLWQAYNSYDPEMGVSFEAFLYTCLQKKFKTELTRRNRQKRILDQFAISLEGINENGDEYSLLDIIPSDFDTLEEVLKDQDNGQYQDKMQEYLCRLSTRQINILNLLIDGYCAKEIQEKLKMSKKEYSNDLKAMRSYENIKILRQEGTR